MGETILESLDPRARASRADRSARSCKRVRLEAGLSIRELGAGDRVDPGHLRGRAWHSGDSAGRTRRRGCSVGHDASVRCFPSSGPRVRDHHQVRMIEALLGMPIRAGSARLEVPVYRPVHGVIDVVLDDARRPAVIVRRGPQRAARRSMRRSAGRARRRTRSRRPTAGRGAIGRDPERSRLLLLRDTAANARHSCGSAADVRVGVSGLVPPRPSRRSSGTRSMAGRSAIVWVHIDGSRTAGSSTARRR